MEKSPFTPEGFRTLISLIYLLTDTELQLESASLQKDLRQWVLNHFLLDKTGIRFLNGISDEFISMAAKECQYVINNRGNISLVQAEKPSDELMANHGIMICLNRNKTNTNPGLADDSVSEELIFSITYPVVKQT